MEPVGRAQARDVSAGLVGRVVGAVLAGLLTFGAAEAASRPVAGINLSGGEFNPARDQRGVDYDYPAVSDLEYFATHKFRVVRLPFLAKRLLDPATKRPPQTPTDMQTVLDLVDAAAALNLVVVLDMHDYGFARTGELIGSTPQSVESFASSWGVIASVFRDRRNVFFGLMNEPHFQSAQAWADAANAAIRAIRDTGARQGILVSGTDWSVASRWTRSGNAEALLGIVDPINNFAFEVHQYLDPDESGKNASVRPGAGASSLADFTTWARANGRRGFLGEFAWANAPDAQREGDALLGFMEANADVWTGWAYWGGGALWGSYMFAVGPGRDEDRPQMRLLRKHIERALVVDTAR